MSRELRINAVQPVGCGRQFGSPRRISKTARNSAVLLSAALGLLAPCGVRAETPAESPAATTAPAMTPPTRGAVTPMPPRRSFPPAPVVPFTEDSSQQGKVTADLKGVWLLVVNATMAPGKFKNLPQVFKITPGKNGPTFHLLDVVLPNDIADTIHTADLRKQAWQPDAAALKTLRQSWSTLPLAKVKRIEEFLYAKIHYQIIAPDKYDQVFLQRDEAEDKLLKGGNKFAFLIREEYAPRDLGPDSRMSQMISRDTVYVVKQVDKDTIKGDALLGIVSAGPGMPLPFKFAGPFVMSRLSSE